MKFVDRIASILGGHSPIEYMSRSDQYLASLAIDPDYPTDGGVRSGGVITPVSYAKFSSSGPSGAPIWLLTTSKNTNLYAYMRDGEFISYDSAFSETVIGTPTSGAGNGAAYYNNYIYLATPTDVSRYGPLDGSPSITNTVWTGATLGSQTALVDVNLFSLGGIVMPNHVMHVHSDNKLYLGDYKNGKGLIHFIKTTKSSAEGDTNDSSAYAALTLPFGIKPVGIKSYGTDIAIICVQSREGASGDVFAPGRAMMYLWDTTSSTFYKEVPIPAPVASAIVNKNGELYIWTGEETRGYQLLRYLGGYSFEEVYFSNEGVPPLAGAVDVDSSRIIWGQTVTTPSTAACVMAIGSRDARLPQRSVFNVAQATANVAQFPIVTAVKALQQNSGTTPRYIVGWAQTGSSSAYGLDSRSLTASAGTFLSRRFVKGRRGQINTISIPLSSAVDAATSIAVNIGIDDQAPTLYRAINNTNDSGARNITLTPNAPFQHSYTIEFVFANTAIGPSVVVPVTIEGDVEG